MFNFTKFTRLAHTALLATGLLSSGLLQAAAGVTLSNQVFEEISVLDARGLSEKKLMPAKVITPGATLAVVISYANNGSEAAEKVEIKNPLVKELAFTGEAGGAGAKVDYSIDGGNSWGALDALKVAGAAGALRPALPSDVTAIRFRLNQPVKPGEQGTVRFSAALR